tara:strand:- start:1034 stop:1615 length:582 start_codon:yes stop_codon:yes gene_type:complete
MANNLYTTDIITTNPIPISTFSSGLLDNPSFFPPSNGYKMSFTPKPGEQIQAAQFRNIKHLSITSGIFELTKFGLTNSHTQWPSRFQLTAPGLGSVDATTASGYKEFPGFYKVVFEDSTNPNNDTNWDFGAVGSTNKVYMWIYFGKNETTGIDSLHNITIDVDIDYHPDPITLAETTTTGPVPAQPNINSFNI